MRNADSPSPMCDGLYFYAERRKIKACRCPVGNTENTIINCECLAGEENLEQLLVMFVGIVRRVYIFIHKNVRRHHTGIMSEASEFQLRSALSLVGEGIL